MKLTNLIYIFPIFLTFSMKFTNFSQNCKPNKTGATGFPNRIDWWPKTGGTGFPKPVIPVSVGGAQLGAQRPEWKKEGFGEVEGDAVMLTPCSVCAKKAGEGRSTRGANL